MTIIMVVLYGVCMITWLVNCCQTSGCINMQINWRTSPPIMLLCNLQKVRSLLIKANNNDHLSFYWTLCSFQMHFNWMSAVRRICNLYAPMHFHFDSAIQVRQSARLPNAVIFFYCKIQLNYIISNNALTAFCCRRYSKVNDRSVIEDKGEWSIRI